MRQAEFEALQKVEKTHWFYKGKRDLVRYWIDKLFRESPSAILDAGAGTGELVLELRKGYERSEVVGVEYSSEARDIAMAHNDLILTAGSILELPFSYDRFDVACALDVLEHVNDDLAAVLELLRVTKVGGAVIINVPALNILWSEWDISLGHHRRYSMKTFRTLLTAARAAYDFHIVSLKYINSIAFLPILLYRQIRKLFPGDGRAEDSLPSEPVNALLYTAFVVPAKWSWFHPPFGASLFCVLRKT